MAAIDLFEPVRERAESAEEMTPLFRKCASGMASSDEAKRHRRPQVDPAGWVVSAHHARLIVSRSVQTVDRRIVAISQGVRHVG